MFPPAERGEKEDSQQMELIKQIDKEGGLIGNPPLSPLQIAGGSEIASSLRSSQ